MTNPNPYPARIASRTRALPLNIEEVARAQHKALKTAEALLDDPNKDTRLRAVHAVNQCALTALRLFEVGELEARVLELEGQTLPTLLGEVYTPAREKVTQ